jgi:multidrug efflux pump subunit AcrA (membrane-fusion protein)
LQLGAASPLVVTGRVLLLLGAATALGGAVVLAHAHDRAGQRAVGRYVCPMHAEVVSGTPGDCPICGMALEQVKEWTPPAAAKGQVDTAKPLVLATQVRAPAQLSADGVVTAVLYEDDYVGMAPGEHALFFGVSAPAVGIEVRRSAEAPESIDSSTSRVRFRMIRNPTHADVGLLQIAARPRDVLAVPASAVLFSADGPYVLVASRDGEPFAKRPIEIGRILDSSYAAGVSGDSIGAIVVLSGLRAGERVVAGDTFFVDAERRLRLGRGQSQVAP